MKTIKEIRDWLLKNAVDNEGDLYLNGLDLSNFNGNVYINYMKVKKKLYQDCQNVGENLYQDCQNVGENLWQENQNVGKNLWQENQNVGENLWQDNQIVGKDLMQQFQNVKGVFYNHKLNDDEYWKEEERYVIRKKKLQTITRKQLAEMGYELEEEK